MRKFMCAAVISALAFTAVAPTTASAVIVVHPAAAAATGGTAGAAAAGGFIGFVAALDIYDIIRRTTCSGDFLGLGGPGFGEPLKVGMNVMTPQCPTVHKAKHKKPH